MIVVEAHFLEPRERRAQAHCLVLVSLADDAAQLGEAGERGEEGLVTKLVVADVEHLQALHGELEQVGGVP